MGAAYGKLDTREAYIKGYLPARVFLDGREIEDVVVVNDIEGWVEVYRVDGNGHAILGENAVAEVDRLCGDVVYVPSPRYYSTRQKEIDTKTKEEEERG